jgi:microcystin-dependent protein
MNFIVRLQGLTSELGEVKMFAGGFAPTGYALANGQIFSVANNTPLYSALGTTFGGNGTTTFALPDLRGRTPVHIGQSFGLSNWSQGEQRGAESVTLTAANLPAHVHALSDHPEPDTHSTGASAPFSLTKPSLGLNHAMATTNPPGAPTAMLGRIKTFAGATLPAGYTQPNGQLFATATNPVLQSVLQYTYGGNGGSVFAMPDLRGRAAMGAGTGAGLTPRVLGEAVGEESVTLTMNQMPSHVHGLQPRFDPPEPAEFTGATGGGTAPFEILQPSLPLRYIIAMTGTYPIEASSAPASDVPWLGEVSLFAGDTAPTGWSFAEGQELTISGNLALFSVIHSDFGGVSGSTFRLPDLRGRIPVGVGQGFGLGDVDMGQRWGFETNALSLATLATHTHDYVPIPVPEPTGATLVLLGACVPLLSRRRRSGDL